MNINGNKSEPGNSFASRAGNYLDTIVQSEGSQAEGEYKAFSFGRVGNRAQPMVTFVKNDGYTEAISYAKLDRISSVDTDRQLVLDFGDQQVQIDGTGLADLFRYLSTNRCTEVKEQAAFAAFAQTGCQTSVTSIIVSRRTR